MRAAHMAAPTLWHHPNFLRVWIGQSVSQFGNQFTGLALQFLALKTLLASPAQMGLLGAMGTLPFLLIGLLVGVWVDRHRRRPILIAGDLGRGFIVVAIAVFTLLGIVRMEYLYVLGFATGVLTVFFDVSYQAYLPALVPRGQIVEGNSKLEASNTTAQVAGPVLAGFALKAVGYAFAIVADGLTLFFSAGLMARIAPQETVPAVSERRSVATEIREGLRVVFRDRRLWSIAGCTGTANLFSGALFALFTLYAVRILGLDEVGIGTIGGIGGIGGILGAVTANRLANRIGTGRAIVVGIAAGSVSSLGVLLPGPTPDDNSSARGRLNERTECPSLQHDHIAKKAPIATRAPSPTRITPITRLNSTVRTPSFSAKIAIEIPPIHSKLIDPEMNRTSMNSQQQPMQ